MELETWSVVTFLLLFSFIISYNSSHGDNIAYSQMSQTESNIGPTITDKNIRAELVYRGISFPTSMAFLGEDDILVLEKNEGTVKRIINGKMLDDPLLKVNVSNEGERGLLGIAVNKTNGLNGPIHVFISFTENKTETSDSEKQTDETDYNLYRYELVNGKLVNPTIVLDLPSTDRTAHFGGVIAIGDDNKIYMVTGDMRGENLQTSKLDGRGAILAPSQDNQKVNLGENDPQFENLYYANGIRNSFGFDFDPVTGKIWDTENGVSYGDEINLVKDGFNSGWPTVQGFWEGEGADVDDPDSYVMDPDDVSSFEGHALYGAPQLATTYSAGLTSLKFIDSNRYGTEYENNMLVGDFHNGFLYKFGLDKERDDLILEGPLADRISNGKEELDGHIVGKGFGGITDIELGPDKYIYILSLAQGGDNCGADPKQKNCIGYSSSLVGSIYRLIPQ